MIIDLFAPSVSLLQGNWTLAKPVLQIEGKWLKDGLGDLATLFDGGAKFMVSSTSFSGNFKDYIEEAKENLKSIQTNNSQVLEEMEDRHEANRNATLMAWQWILDMNDIMVEMESRNLQVSAHVDEDAINNVDVKIKEEIDTLDRYLEAMRITVEKAEELDAKEAAKFREKINKKYKGGTR